MRNGIMFTSAFYADSAHGGRLEMCKLAMAVPKVNASIIVDFSRYKSYMVDIIKIM